MLESVANPVQRLVDYWVISFQICVQVQVPTHISCVLLGPDGSADRSRIRAGIAGRSIAGRPLQFAPKIGKQIRIQRP